MLSAGGYALCRVVLAPMLGYSLDTNTPDTLGRARVPVVEH